MGLLGHMSKAGVICAFLATLSLASGLKCLSCRGQNVYECIMSAMIKACDKGEECRFRMLFPRHYPSRVHAWFEGGCASIAECRAPDNEFYAHFCCRISYCNYIPAG